MLIKVHVTTDAKKENVKKISADRYDISVREPAEENSANARVLEIIRGIFLACRARIVSGHRARSKIISVEPKK